LAGCLGVAAGRQLYGPVEGPAQSGTVGPGVVGAGDIRFWHIVVYAVTVTDALFVTASLLGIALLGRSLASSSRRTAWRDPKRVFTQSERAAIFARAGNRCEHRGLLLRCRAGAAHADHVWPWVDGGPTSVANGQALCARHNLSKGSKHPSSWYVLRLERARRRYFPPGAPTDVVRRRA
jgi:hypothetical protein